ncbi:conserved hypothetical protein [Candidatus Nitrotoga sp. BS]|uniref:hypothetical protein n=1 Tax=Candidatus Nitrotoga sp. BS TaxID=2890408 RepID=UPI001EF34E15|nr:hypothetical protein [Candidatus Nitrotoga sp. BS]CAH1208832.1 conserved hypothetical protein [Candidatus Nitrotoga sp. BS]
MKMNDACLITAIFCDDIRQEVGNKLSFMGCYQGELVVQMAPITLPKLCVFASILTPKERPLKSLTLRVVQDVDIELARVDIPKENLTVSSQILDETSTRTILSTAIVFAPFAIEKSTVLRLMATTEEGEITGPRLLVKVAATKESAAQSASKPKTAKPRTIK